MDKIRLLLLKEVWCGDETEVLTPPEAPMPGAYQFRFEVEESRIQQHLRGRMMVMWRHDIVPIGFEITYDQWCEAGRDHRREVQEEYNTVTFYRTIGTWEWAVDIADLQGVYDFLTKRLDRIEGELKDAPDGVPTLYAVIV